MGKRAWTIEERADAVREVIYRLYGAAEEIHCYVVDVYDDHAIVVLRLFGSDHIGPGPFYKVAYTISGDEITIAAREDWIEVEKEWAERAIITPGGELRALDDEGRVGGYLVLYGSPDERELDGYYFTDRCNFGPRDGDGAFCLFHHGIPLHPDLRHLAERQFAPLNTERRELGLWAETVLNMADEYEQMIFRLAKDSKLGWSGGAAPHLVRATGDGEIVQFPIAEGSMTPSPRQPRSKVVALRAISSGVDPAMVAELTQALTPRAGPGEGLAAGAVTRQPMPAELAPIRASTPTGGTTMSDNPTPDPEVRTTPEEDLQDPAVRGALNFDELALRTVIEKVTDNLWARMQEAPAMRTGLHLTEPPPPADDVVAAAAMRAWNRYLMAGHRVVTPDAYQSWVPESRRATLQVDQDIGGGYLTAPEQWVALLIKAVDNYVHVRQRATVHPVEGADSLGVPTLDTDVSDPTWTAELAIGSEDTGVEFGKRALHPHPLAKYIKVSKTLLRRSRLGIDALIRDRLAYKFGIAQENAFLNGGGSGEPLGMFTASNNGISTGRDSVCGAVVADVINGDDLINAKYTLKQQYWPNAVWIMHRDLAKTIRKLKTTTDYIWAPRLGESPATILGIPYLLSEYAPNTYTANLYIAILGDLSFYWIADAMDSLEVQVLVELYAATNQNAYIGRMESDGMPVLEEAFVRLKMAAA